MSAPTLPGALAIYEEVLAASGDRADVLVAISGDLGSHGHVAEIIELVAPRYDAERHGPATGEAGREIHASKISASFSVRISCAGGLCSSTALMAVQPPVALPPILPAPIPRPRLRTTTA